MHRICHMTSAHTSLDTRIFYKECVSLAKAGYKTYLVAPGESFERDGVHIVGVGEKPTSRFKRMTETTQKVYRAALALNADLYHFHDPELLPYGLKLKNQGKYVIFDSHENYFMQIVEKEYLPKLARKMIAMVYHTVETFITRRIDAVVVPCTMGGANFFDKRAQKNIVISNYPVLSAFYEQYKSGTPEISSLCYIGGLTHQRGITQLVVAAYRAKMKLVLAGKFMPPSYKETLFTMPEYSCVDYKGILEQTEIIALLNQVTIGACVLLNKGQYNKADTFGIKVYEYMAMGLPVILSDCTYAHEMIRKYKFGICVDPSDVQAIADAIIYLRDHPEEAREMGQNGRRAVLEEFNWETQEKKLLELYASLTTKAEDCNDGTKNLYW